MMRTAKAILFLLLGSSLVFFSCKKKKLDPHEIRSDYYFQATVEGTQYTYQEGEDDYLNIIGDFGAGSEAAGLRQYIPFTCIAHEDGLFSQAGLANSGAVGVIHTTSAILLPQQLGDRILTGEQGIGVRSYDSSDPAEEGGFVSWVDPDGTEWTSNGPQTDASFNIKEYIDREDPESNTHKVIMVEFNCTLYNGNGGSRRITDGKARGRLIVY